MKFQQSLNEEFFTSFMSTDIEISIYKNPTKQEFANNIAVGSRGFIKPNGDLFLEGYDIARERSKTVHGEIFLSLGNSFNVHSYDYSTGFSEYYKGKELKYGIAVQRLDDTNTILLSESVFFSKMFDVKNVEILFERSKRKNKNLKFSWKEI